MTKFDRVRQLVADRAGNNARMLDIGCRTKVLKRYVEQYGVYHGADLFQTGSVEYVGDFTKGLPVGDREYTITFALDVIEHTADMTAALDEIMRITSDCAIVIIPNHAHIGFRIGFLIGGRISNKWDVRFPLPEDRHRWLTTCTQSDAYMRAYTSSRGLHLEILDSQFGLLAPFIERSIGRVLPNLFVRNRLYVVSRAADASQTVGSA